MHQVDAATGTTAHTTGHGLLRSLGIHIFMIVWAVAGLAYTDIFPARSVPFWMLTTILFGVIAIIHVVRSDRPDRTVMVLKQVVHWAAFLGAMFLLHSHAVMDLVAGDPFGLVVLILLGLATFLDGVYVDWRFCIVGLVLGSGVVLVAWLDDWALVLALATLVVVAAAALFFVMRHLRARRAQA